MGGNEELKISRWAHLAHNAPVDVSLAVALGSDIHGGVSIFSEGGEMIDAGSACGHNVPSRGAWGNKECGMATDMKSARLIVKQRPRTEPRVGLSPTPLTAFPAVLLGNGENTKAVSAGGLSGLNFMGLILSPFLKPRNSPIGNFRHSGNFRRGMV
jgi:hypothetical protein